MGCRTIRERYVPIRARVISRKKSLGHGSGHIDAKVTEMVGLDYRDSDCGRPSSALQARWSVLRNVVSRNNLHQDYMARFWRRNGGHVNRLVCVVGGSVSRPRADILGTARAADAHRRAALTTLPSRCLVGIRCV